MDAAQIAYIVMVASTILGVGLTGFSSGGYKAPTVVSLGHGITNGVAFAVIAVTLFSAEGPLPENAGIAMVLIGLAGAGGILTSHILRPPMVGATLWGHAAAGAGGLALLYGAVF